MIRSTVLSNLEYIRHRAFGTRGVTARSFNTCFSIVLIKGPYDLGHDSSILRLIWGGRFGIVKIWVSSQKSGKRIFGKCL